MSTRSRSVREAHSLSHSLAAPKLSFTPVQSGLLQRKCACGKSSGLTGECSECQNKRLTLQRRSANQASPDEVPPIVHEVLRSPGQPLDSDTRTFMEPRFGHDFSQVRVHTDAKAAESAQAVNALAYTIGGDIVFGAGQYAPRKKDGQRLLAHELTHSIQQGTQSITPSIRLAIGQTNSPLEQEANHIADALDHSEVFGAGQYVSGKNNVPMQLRSEFGMSGVKAERAERLVQISTSKVGSPILQRWDWPWSNKEKEKGYGHAKSCTQDEHLGPFIWPAHGYAKNVMARAIEELDKTPLEPTAMTRLKRLFGKDSTIPGNLTTIRANFNRINNALEERYLYHCANPCETPHKGFRAWTDDSGNKDITICFDQVAGYTIPAAGWLIVHENVHRGLNVWPNPHPWVPEKFKGCSDEIALSDSSLVLNNPDSYACFASRM